MISATAWRAVELGSIPKPPTKYVMVEPGSIPGVGTKQCPGGEMADTLVLGTSVERRGSSSLPRGTKGSID